MEKDAETAEKFKDKPLESYGFSMSMEDFEQEDIYYEGTKANLGSFKEALDNLNKKDLEKNDRNCKLQAFRKITYDIKSLIEDGVVKVGTYEETYRSILLSGYFSIEESIEEYNELKLKELYIENTSDPKLENLIILTADFILLSREIIKQVKMKNFKQGFFDYLNLDGTITTKNKEIKDYNKSLGDKIIDELDEKELLSPENISTSLKIKRNSLIRNSFFEFLKFLNTQMQSLEEVILHSVETSDKHLMFKKEMSKRIKYHLKKQEKYLEEILDLNSKFLKELFLQLRKTKEQLDKEFIKFLSVKRGFIDKEL